MMKQQFTILLFILLLQPINTFAQTITIIHPETDEIVSTFTPAPFQLETDFVSFEKEVQKEIEKLAKTFYHPLLLDRLNNQNEIVPGTNEKYIQQEKLLTDALTLSFTGGKVEIPFQTRPSNYNREEAAHLTETVLSSFTTYYNPRNVGRSTNIEISASSINKVIVGSGDIFSFNTTVGPRSLDFGYQVAPEIVNGKTVLGVGGGICQTASTLFNAVDKLGVETIERHHHSKDVGYVPKGRDATVSFGGLDYQFQNTLGIPFLIRTYAKHGQLTIFISTSQEFAQLLQNELAE